MNWWLDFAFRLATLIGLCILLAPIVVYGFYWIQGERL